MVRTLIPDGGLWELVGGGGGSVPDLWGLRATGGRAAAALAAAMAATRSLV